LIKNPRASPQNRFYSPARPQAVLNHGKTLGTALRGEVEHEELQNLMAGGQELAELETSLGGKV